MINSLEDTIVFIHYGDICHTVVDRSQKILSVDYCSESWELSSELRKVLAQEGISFDDDDFQAATCAAVSQALITRGLYYDDYVHGCGDEEPQYRYWFTFPLHFANHQEYS